MRLNKCIAGLLSISRRKADEYIKKGSVKVNGKHVELGMQVQEGDTIEVIIKSKTHRVTIPKVSSKTTVLMYKPIFCVTSLSDPQKRKTIKDILPYQYKHLKPAGRLDFMSEGLLVCSNDGDLIHSLTHPKFGTKKSYLVAVKKPLSSDFITKARKGITLEGYSLNPVEINHVDSSKQFSYLKPDAKQYWYIFTLTEGRNNQIRKMVSLTGQNVMRLIRVGHGIYKMSKELKENGIKLV